MTNQNTTADTQTDTTAETENEPDGVDIDQFDDNRQAALLSLKALNKLGLQIPVNQPILRQKTTDSTDYLVIIPLGPAIGNGGAKVACMVWDVTEDTDEPITFTIDNREAETWVEGFSADELNTWVNPTVDAEYDTYPLEKDGENRFRLVETSPFLDAFDTDTASDDSPSPSAGQTEMVQPPDTTLDAPDDPMYY